MLTIAFSVAKAQIDLQQQIKGIILTAIEKKSSKSTASNLAADYATYLHGDVQSHMSSVSMKLNQAADSGEIEVGKGVIDNLASVLARDHQNYVVSQALSPIQKFQKIIDAWDGIAKISIDVIDDQISQSLLLDVSEILEELVSNAIRHAGAQVIEVQIQAEDKYLLLTTKDDGKNYTKGKKGVGTELIKNKTVSQSYSREEDRNVFTFKLPL
jgi:signal transduction histidine kinase